MTTFVLVHGAWHGGWAWDRVAPLLAHHAEVITPSLGVGPEVGLRTHAEEVAAVLDALPAGRRAVLVGHSYGGLVVRQAADRRPDGVARLVLLDGWAGTDGAGMFTLAPGWFTEACRGAAVDGLVPAPPPAAFGITDPALAEWLGERLRPHPLRTFTDVTELSGACDQIPGTALCCQPAVFDFAALARNLDYTVETIDGPHDVMLTAPDALAQALLTAAGRSGVSSHL
jgi:pimeloyl-ACP methyl ester carboxylesterase